MAKTIMVVDDSSSMRQMVNFALASAGYEVVEAADGADALAKSGVQKVDLFITDLNMPNMNGLEVLHWLRNSHSEQDVAIYLLTSSEDRAHKEQAAADGVTEYLLKSHLFGELITHLDRLIATNNAQRLNPAGKMEDVIADLAFTG